MATTKTPERLEQQRRYKAERDARERRVGRTVAALNASDWALYERTYKELSSDPVTRGATPSRVAAAVLDTMLSDAFDAAHDERILRETLADTPSDDGWRCSGKYGCGKGIVAGDPDWEPSPTKPYLHRHCYNEKHRAYMAPEARAARAAAKAAKVGASA